MKTTIDCIPCFIHQTLDAIRMLTNDQMVHKKVVREILAYTSTMDFDRTPPQMGQIIHQLIRKVSGNQDPYYETKKRSNKFALKMYPELKRRITSSADWFETAVRLAIAGNVIDFGTSSQVDNDIIYQSIEDALVQPLEKYNFERLKNAINRAENILYIGDNAGEIVFDRLLIEQLPNKKITYAVRGAPTINDATREDAEMVGLTDLVLVIDNGTDIPGTVIENCSGDFRMVFDSADLTIAKGQGNYETLNDTDKKIFFLFKVKCPVVARNTGCTLGNIAIYPG